MAKTQPNSVASQVSSVLYTIISRDPLLFSGGYLHTLRKNIIDLHYLIS